VKAGLKRGQERAKGYLCDGSEALMGRESFGSERDPLVVLAWPFVEMHLARAGRTSKHLRGRKGGRQKGREGGREGEREGGREGGKAPRTLTTSPSRSMILPSYHTCGIKYQTQRGLKHSAGIAHGPLDTTSVS
jgi:hypothetical protein